MFKNLKIKTKIITGMLLLTVIPLILVTSILYSNIKGYLLDTALSEETHDIMMKKNSIGVFLDNMEAEVLFLSKLHSIEDFINSKEEEDKRELKEMLTRDFLSFSKERKIYYQIRYIDENGQEIVRIDNDGNNTFRIPDDELQNKAGRYYFEDSMKAKQGVVFVSPLDLNIEGESIENRGTVKDSIYVPVLRYATPIFDNQNKSKGIIITNVYADNFLSHLDETYLGTTIGKEIYLVNKEGYYLHHPDAKKEWAFMFDGNDENINNHCSQAFRFFNEESGQFYSKDTDCFLTFGRIYPSGQENLDNSGSNQAYSDSISKIQGEEYYWVLVSRVEGSAIFSEIDKALNNIVLIVLITVLVVLFVAFSVGKSIVSPINRLRKDIKIITEGDIEHKVGTNATDEVGDLSRAFDVMTSAIKKSRSEIDQKVKKQTKEIISNSKKLENQQAAVLNILEDVEEEKARTEDLAKDLEKFKLAVDNTSDHIVITDRDGGILYANQAVETITGYTAKEIMGQKAGIKKLWSGNMAEDFYEKLWKTITEDKKSFIGDIANTRKNGEDYDAVTSISPILDDDGEVKFIVAVERDVTKERQIDRAKSEFVSLASHQLRTPLSTVNWYAEMLLSEDAGKLNKGQQEFVSEIYKGNQRMVDLVNALLNVSRIELGTLAVDPKPTDLIVQAESVLNEIKPLIAKKKLKVIKKFDKAIPKITLDDKLMRIVWQNLLSNSLKYTPEKGKIGISITKDKTNVKIEVSDTGMGIPKAQQKNIFTKLFRADNVRERETDGTGLGLYIVKSVIQQFGGKVWFKSVENKGTTFYVTIPLKGIKAKEGSKGLEYTK